MPTSDEIDSSTEHNVIGFGDAALLHKKGRREDPEMTAAWLGARFAPGGVEMCRAGARRAAWMVAPNCVSAGYGLTDLTGVQGWAEARLTERPDDGSFAFFGLA